MHVLDTSLAKPKAAPLYYEALDTSIGRDLVPVATECLRAYVLWSPSNNGVGYW